MAKILICDDEAGLHAVIKRYAILEGHVVMKAREKMMDEVWGFGLGYRFDG